MARRSAGAVSLRSGFSWRLDIVEVHPRSMACSHARAPNGDLSQIPRLTFAGHFRLYSGVPAQPAAARLLYLIE